MIWLNGLIQTGPKTQMIIDLLVTLYLMGSIAWSSKKQSTVMTLSVKAGCIISANPTKEAIWLYTLLQELDFLQATTTIIHADNQGCICNSKQPYLVIPILYTLIFATTLFVNILNMVKYPLTMCLQRKCWQTSSSRFYLVRVLSSFGWYWVSCLLHEKYWIS